MDNEKPWYQSKTVWNAIVQVFVGIAISFGWVTSAVGVEMQSNLPDVIIGAVAVIQAIITMYGRVKAQAVITT